MPERFSCARVAAGLGEPLYATASQVRRWLLVEQPGTWGGDAVSQSALPPPVAARLKAEAGRRGARLLLIRRFGRPNPGPLSCFVAITTPQVQHIERLFVDAADQLLDVDWSPLSHDRPVGGDTWEGPLFLVCTNGRHDACCAEFGRPLARALDAARGQQVWESSHFGGDRFAANLVCLPHGIFYGRVAPEDGSRVADSYEHNRLELAHYRGRSCHPFVVQAADYFLRQHHALKRLDDLRVQAVRRDDDERFTVTMLDADGQQLRARLLRSRSPAAQRLTCHSEAEEHPYRYRLLGLD